MPQQQHQVKLYLNSAIANLPLPYSFPGVQRMALSFITEGHFSSFTTVRGKGVTFRLVRDET